MKLFLGLLIAAVVVLLMLAPMWGWLGAQGYAAIAALGGVLGHGRLSDGVAAFRAGVIIGGSISVLSLLRVAWRDRSLDYLISGVMVGGGLFSLIFFIGLFSGPAAWADGSRAGFPVASGPGVPQWGSRRLYESAVRDRVHDIARAAARGDHRRADDLLAELRQWPTQRPRAEEDRAEYERLNEAFRATFAEARRGEGRGELYAERKALLQQMQQAWPSSSSAGIRLLNDSIQRLYFSMRMTQGVRDRSRGHTLEAWLVDIHAQQETLMAYAPAMPALWNSYAVMMVDTDEELALGALVTAKRLEQQEAMQSSKGGYTGMQAPQFGVHDLTTASRLAQGASQTRWEITEARAQALTDRAGGATATQQDEPAMPPAGRVAQGKGLAGAPHASPSAAPVDPAMGAAVVGLDQLGFSNAAHGIVLPPSGVTAHSRAMLVLDLWEDGTVTSVLIEESSGDPALDLAARIGARNWKYARIVPAGGERRRVLVAFHPPTQDQQAFTPVGPDAPPPPRGEALK